MFQTRCEISMHGNLNSVPQNDDHHAFEMPTCEIKLHDNFHVMSQHKQIRYFSNVYIWKQTANANHKTRIRKNTTLRYVNTNTMQTRKATYFCAHSLRNSARQACRGMRGTLRPILGILRCVWGPLFGPKPDQVPTRWGSHLGPIWLHCQHGGFVHF